MAIPAILRHAVDGLARRLAIGLIAGCVGMLAPVTQSVAAEGEISIELNRLAKGANGCLVSFVMQNGIGAPIEDLTLEVVLFDADGQVDRILLLSSGALPKDKTRVKQFELEGTACEGVSQILLNDVSSCKGEGLDAAACLAKLTVKSKANVKFTL